MSEPMRLGLDNPVFSGRLRVSGERSFASNLQSPRPAHRPVRSFDRQVREAFVKTDRPAAAAPTPIWSQPLSQSGPALSQSEPAQLPVPNQYAAEQAVAAEPLAGTPLARWLDRSSESEESYIRRLKLSVPGFPRPDAEAIYQTLKSALKLSRYTRLQLALIGMAVVIFALGVTVSINTTKTNHANAVKVAALAKKADDQASVNGGSSVPSTVKPSAAAVNNYVVAPDLPRYIEIPQLKVRARVMQTGIRSDGSLGTPNNVYDTAWYTGSSRPGEPGAMLIDGHVSSWTTPGVFYGLSDLAPGTVIKIQRGDGKVFTYKIVKSHTYSDDHVDMKAAMRPVNPDKPGLNLISCTGRVKPGTSEFDKRVIVFAEQI
jgi:sortase (surface protein transpeptidase)